MKRIIALLLAMVICLLLCACGKSDAAIACENLINAIGEVTLDSKDAIEAAENAYSALTDEEKESISESKEILVKSRTLFDNAVMKANAEKVISAIDAIGVVTLDSKERIDTAKGMYDALSEAEKNLVDNYSVLITAESDYSVLHEEERQKIIDELLPRFDVRFDRVTNEQHYVPNAMPKHIDDYSFVIPYIGTRDNLICIKIRYNYVGKDAIFWKSLAIMADEQRYTLDVKYNNVTRDYSTLPYFECYDQDLTFNTPLDDSNIQMLKAISEADEAIVRFKGDAYRYDHTVTKQEKEAIRDVIELYGVLIG